MYTTYVDCSQLLVTNSIMTFFIGKYNLIIMLRYMEQNL